MTIHDWSQVLPDIPRFYTALAEWLACFLSLFWTNRRLKGAKFAAVSFAALVIQTVFLVVTDRLEGILWFVCMAAAIGMMYLYIYICSGMGWRNCAYYCVEAFVAAEFAASFEWQMDCFFTYGLGWHTPWLWAVWLVLLYGLVYALFGALYKKYWQEDDKLPVTNRELVSYCIIGLSVFLMSNLGFVPMQTPFSTESMSEVFAIRTLFDLGGMAILYAYHEQRLELHKKYELESVQNMLHNQYVQYEQAQETIDLLNYKHHDLKHHILALRAEEDEKKRGEYLDRMEEEIKAYESQYKTGNHVLDTLLTVKDMCCRQNEISMTCVVDGMLFDFMDVMDICSIFGNALDNAIEYEKTQPAKEKRLIQVSAYSRHNFLIIHIENYCGDMPGFAGELPATTKDDARFHGYGLKSIRYTAQKYGGEADVGVHDHWFHVKILIPRGM